MLLRRLVAGFVVLGALVALSLPALGQGKDKAKEKAAYDDLATLLGARPGTRPGSRARGPAVPSVAGRNGVAAGDSGG